MAPSETKLPSWANYVELSLKFALTLHRYNMSFEPQVTGRKLNQVVCQLLGSAELAEFRDTIISDFKSTLISRKNFEPGYVDKQPTIQALNTLINHTARVSEGRAVIGSTRTFDTTHRDDGKGDLGAGLMAIGSFFASVRAAIARMLVNVNVNNGVFYRPILLKELMLRYNEKHKDYQLLERFVKKMRITMMHIPGKSNRSGKPIPQVRTIVGFATKSDGQGQDNQPRVDEFAAGPTKVHFWMDARPGGEESPAGGRGGKKGNGTGGKYVSVHDYFRDAYNIPVEDRTPVVNVGSRERPTYLPAEVCQVIPGQYAKTKLDPEQTQNMIKFAVRKPCGNALSIVNDGLSAAGFSASTNRLLSRFDLTVTENLLQVPARVLPAPKVMYKGTAAEVRDGGWNMKSIKFNLAVPLKKWSFLVIARAGVRNDFRSMDDVNRVVREFQESLRRCGVQAEKPFSGQLLTMGGPHDKALDTKMDNAAREGAKMLLVILPAFAPVIYSRIKSAGDLRLGLHTICVLGDKVFTRSQLDQYFGNVGLKVNLKLGGHNQAVESPRLKILSEGKTMVVGIDVTHPSPGSSGTAPSIACMVASVDRHVAQWPGVLRLQSQARQEMVSQVKEMFKSRLRLWKMPGRNKEYPENIVVYRDGVSEGQYSKVMDEEIPLFREACKELYPPLQKGIPRLTVIIVTKRHNTRLYPTDEAKADKGSNNRPGTVVDRGITEVGTWDFYLQSHAAIRRTARPAHYLVVLDEVFRAKAKSMASFSGLNAADALETLSQALCYTYGRATKAVSICAPIYYADILCERARVYLTEVYDATSEARLAELEVKQSRIEVHTSLRDTIFYL